MESLIEQPAARNTAWLEMRRELARRNLIDFCQYIDPNYQASAPHRLLAETLERTYRGEINRLIVNFPRRHGKQLADTTPMLTANRGWTTHGELQLGDYVFGLNGQPVRVLAISEPSLQDCRVVFQNGESINCHENHEWVLYDRANRRSIQVETKFFFGLNRNSNKRKLLVDRHSTYLLPKRAALQYPTAKLPLHPYALGVWLGDGRTSNPDFCYSVQDKIVYDSVLALGYKESWHTVHKTTGVHYAGFQCWGALLRELGVLGRKHIPKSYLQASVEQRMELLAGLIDTDGSTEKGGCRIRIVTVSDELRDNIIELLTGLGFNPYCFTQAPALSSSGIQGNFPVHYIGLSANQPIPCRIERKKPKTSLSRTQKIGLKSVERCNPIIGRCIQVDAVDGIYLAGRKLTPTHNSRMVSQMWPCWMLGQEPRLKIVQTGYAAPLTLRHSRSARDIFASHRFNGVFPNVHHNPGTEGQKHIATVMQTAHEWGTTNGGSYYAVGVGGALAGFGFSVGILDDPHKNRKEAQSKVAKENVWEWFRSVFYPAQDSDEIRREAAIVLVMTRWTMDDLTGMVQLLSDEFEGEKWHVLSMPAVSDENGNACDFENPTAKALWPERWPLEKLKRIKSLVGQVEWSAQYQQSPRPMDGNQLDSRLLKMISIDELRRMNIVSLIRPWDLAFTDTKQSDFVAGMKMGMDERGNIILIDLCQIKGRWTQSYPVIMDKADRDGVDCVVGIEANGTQAGYADIMREKLPLRSVIPLIPEGNKEMRASAWGTRLQDGIIYCVRAPWNQLLFDEMDYFGSVDHDDIIDSVSHGWKFLKGNGPTATVVDHRPDIERIDFGRYNRRGGLL